MAARVPPGTGLRKRTQLARGPRARASTQPAGAAWLHPMLCKLSVLHQGGPRTGRTRRRLGVRPALPLALMCRTDRCPAGRLARSAENHGPLLNVRSSRTSDRLERRCRWPIPDLHGDPARGLTTANSGQAASRPSARTGYEAPPPRKSGTVQLPRAGSPGERP
jgi:hypothetical protein